MTKRQQHIAAQVQAIRDELIPEASSLPLGHTVAVSLPVQFIGWRGQALQPCARPLRVLLRRESDAIRYQEAAPVWKKGRHEPRWRTLARVNA